MEAPGAVPQAPNTPAMNLLKWHTRLCFALGVLDFAVIVAALVGHGAGDERFDE